MAVSEGYPQAYQKGYEITGLSNIGTDSVVFHAGTQLQNGHVLTNGGRVLAITSLGDTLKSALQKSYNNMNKLCYDNIYYRKDIGYEFI
jgi:phosphoribosylamine--glycine ligase